MTTPKKPSTFPFTKILCSLAILTAIAALYVNWQLREALSQNTSTVTSLAQQQTSTEARLQAYRSATQEHELRAKSERLNLAKSLNLTRAACENVSEDWRLQKARHLLELAQLNAHWSQDKASTIAMLTEADKTLAPLHNPALLDVRGALADDLHAQSSAPTTDVTALLAQLSTAQKSTWTLPINPSPEAQKVTLDDTTDSRQARAINFIKHLVVIRHTDEALLPQATLAYEATLRASIRLSLQEAGWAVLERNDKVYQMALERAKEALQQSFLSDATETKALMALLEQLKEATLHPEPLVPTGALTALNQVIQTTETSRAQAGDAA